MSARLMSATLMVAALGLVSPGSAQDRHLNLNQSLAAKLDGEVPALLEKYSEPGLAVVLVESCKPAWIRTYGLADRASGRKISADTAFNLGSISKTLTAWRVMKLAEAGRINLDGPVDQYLKRWHLPAGAFDQSKVTVRQLLSHTAGISVPSVGGSDVTAPQASLLDELKGNGPSGAAVVVSSEPGAKYAYSGGGYAILQLLIEDVTGRTFDEDMKAEVLRPLGMSAATFAWNDGVARAVATPYREKGDAYPLRLYPVAAAAGLYASPADLQNFLLAHCTPDSKQVAGRNVISPSRLDEMFAVAPNAERYGLGYQVYPPPSGVVIVGHDGSNHGWKANFMMAPRAGFGIFVLSNTDGAKARTDVLRMFRDAVVAGLK